MPPATMDAFRDHGRVERTIDRDLTAADKTMSDLSQAGISMFQVTEKLLEDGIQLFDDAFTKLLAAVELKKTEPAKANPKLHSQYSHFPAPIKQAVDATLENW